MSCNEWESGKIKLPAKVYNKFRKQLMEFWNACEEEKFVSAVHAWQALKDAKLTTSAALKKAGHLDVAHGLMSVLGCSEDFADEMGYLFNEMSYAANRKAGNTYSNPRSWKLLKPTRKVMNFLTNKDRRFESSGWGEWMICFIDDDKSVTWSSGENNHAVEFAHSHKVVKQFFSMLNRVEWTRGSGGKIVGNDEYNQESEYEGGGANYVNYVFGK